MTTTRVLLALLVCLTLTAPVYPGGSEFDGTDSLIAIANQAAVNATAFTAGCWTRAEGLGESSAGRIMDHATGWSIRTVDLAVDRYAFLAVGWDTTDGQWQWVAPAVNVWTHIAVTYDASSTANVPVVYMDGVSQTVFLTATPVGTFTIGTGALTIGNQPAGNRTWDGQLAECFYYNRILSAGEIMEVKTHGPASRGIAIGYWPLGVFGARNYTATAGLTGTPTGITVSTVPLPISYASQGETP